MFTNSLQWPESSRNDGTDEWDVLRNVGEALFGSRWQTDLAEALNVSDRTVRRWLVGNDIPPGIWEDIQRLMAERMERLKALSERVGQVLS